MKGLLIVTTAANGVADVAFAGFVVRLISALGFPCATWGSMVLRQVDIAGALLLPFIGVQALLAHYYRPSLSARLRTVAFLPWAFGLALFIVQRLMFL